MKISNLCLAVTLSASVIACNGGSSSTTNSPAPVPTPTPSPSPSTQPVPLPLSSWVDTGLDDFLSTNGLTMRGNYAVVQDGNNFYSYAADSSFNTHVLTYNLTTQIWSDVTGSLTLPTLDSQASDFGSPYSNSNGKIYIPSDTGLYVNTGGSSWQTVTLPSKQSVFATRVELQTRNVVILGGDSAGDNFQPYTLNLNNTLTPLSNPTNLATSPNLSVIFEVSPNGQYYSLWFNDSSQLEYKVAINGVVANTGVARGVIRTSTLSNNGYIYAFPSFLKDNMLYQCNQDGCTLLSSPMAVAQDGDWIQNVLPLATAGTFMLSLDNQATNMVRAYICDAVSCVQQGNNGESSTIFMFNQVAANPSATAFGFEGGFYWLINNIWTDLAPASSDVMGSSHLISPLCGYTPSTSLVKIVNAQTDISSTLPARETLFANTISGWQDISQSAPHGQRMTYNPGLNSNVNPSNGATTLTGIVGISMNESATDSLLNNTITNMWVYPENIVCPALY